MEPITFLGLDANAWTAVFTGGLVATAIFTVLAARRSWIAEHRSYVVVDFEIDIERAVAWIWIQNIGRTPAENIRIEFEPPLQSSWDSERYRIADIPLWKEIPVLPPQRKLRTFFDKLPHRKEAGLPYRYNVTIRYRSPVTGEDHVDSYELDLAIYSRLTDIFTK
jgi:hypothetical protein